MIAIQKKEQLNYLLDNLNTKAGKKFFDELSDSRLYRFKSNAGYPYFKAFARWLPKEYEAYQTKSLDIYSTQTKKDFITKYKIYIFHFIYCISAVLLSSKFSPSASLSNWFSNICP